MSVPTTSLSYSTSSSFPTDSNYTNSSELATTLSLFSKTSLTLISTATNVYVTDKTEGTKGTRDEKLGIPLLILAIFIIMLNLCMIMVIVRFRTNNAIDYFVLALASSDLTKGLIPVPITVYAYLTDWFLEDGAPLCQFYGWIAFVTNSGSMLILTLMAIERYLAIVKPFKYKIWVRPKKVVRILVLCFLFTAIQSSLPLFGLGKMKSYYGGAYCHFDYSKKGSRVYSLFILTYGFTMILVVMAAYCFVFHKIRDLVRRHRQRERTNSMYFERSTRRQLKFKTETMFSYMTMALMILFWLSWMPFLIIVTASQIGAKPLPDKLDLITMRIVVVSSLLNPIMCALLCKPYRRGILYYFKLCFSIFGLKRPESNIWDPWNRSSRRYKNNKRHTPSYNGGCPLNETTIESSRPESQELFANNRSDEYSSRSSSISSTSSDSNVLSSRKMSRNVLRKNSEGVSKEYNKNIPDNSIQQQISSPSQRQKFIERMQKYLGGNNKKSQKHDLKMQYMRSNSAGTVLEDTLRNSVNNETNAFVFKNRDNNFGYDENENDGEFKGLLPPIRQRAMTLNDMDDLDNEKYGITREKVTGEASNIRSGNISPSFQQVQQKGIVNGNFVKCSPNTDSICMYNKSQTDSTHETAAVHSNHEFRVSPSSHHHMRWNHDDVNV